MSLNCKVVCKRSRAHTTTGQSRVRDSLWCASRAGPQARLASIIASRDSAYHCDKVSSVIDTRVRDASAQPYRERFIPHETMCTETLPRHTLPRALGSLVRAVSNATYFLPEHFVKWPVTSLRSPRSQLFAARSPRIARTFLPYM